MAPLPERVDAQDRQGAADRGQEHGAERGAVDRADAADDGDAADHDRGDDVQFEAVARRRVEVAEPGRVEHAGESGEGAADDERGEDLAPDADPVQPGGLGRRSRWRRAHVRNAALRR